MDCASGASRRIIYLPVRMLQEKKDDPCRAHVRSSRGRLRARRARAIGCVLGVRARAKVTAQSK